MTGRGAKGRRGRGDPSEKPKGTRVPAWVMVPVGLAVGWLVANWPGAIFGGVLGVFLWRSRA